MEDFVTTFCRIWEDVVGDLPQPAIICSKLPIEILEQGVKYVQS